MAPRGLPLSIVTTCSLGLESAGEPSEEHMAFHD